MQIIPIMIPAINGITSWSEFWIFIAAMMLVALILLAIILTVVGLIIAICYIYGRVADKRIERQKTK